MARRHDDGLAAGRAMPSMMRGACQGFTLLELMVVVGVIAILCLLMLPSYLDQIVRKQIQDALPLADIAKTPIASAWTITQTFPRDNASIGLPSADKVVSNLVSSLVVQDGVIHLTFGNRVNSAIRGRVLTLRPAVVEDAPVVPVAWVCGHAPVPGKMTARGVDATTVPEAYLPFSCRAD